MVAHLIPEFCMKINEKLGLSLKDENHFISLLFTLWASLSASDFALRATTGQDGAQAGFPPEADQEFLLRRFEVSVL